MRPLHVLVFLAPLIVLYELGLVLFLSSDGGFVETIEAHRTLGRFFDTLGVTSMYLPGVALAAVLFVWHIANGDRWQVRSGVIGGMFVESCLWVAPLLVFGLLLNAPDAGAAGVTDTGWASARALASAGALAGNTWQQNLTLSIGAGLYEELLFRLILITVLHIALADVMGMKSDMASVLAVAGSAVAFALYHDTTLLDFTRPAQLAFYVGAGVYFGALFLTRGFGVVVGTHAMYDVLALVVFPMLRKGPEAHIGASAAVIYLG